MSSTWYRAGFEIDVADPGYGYLTIATTSEDGMAYSGEWDATLTGAKLGELLAAVTARALGAELPEGADLPAVLTEERARGLLPALQSAVVLAAAGSDRADRLFPDQDAPPEPPLCVRCNAGTPFTGVQTDSAWCREYGHRPFGTTNSNWEATRTKYESDRRWWDVLHQNLPDSVKPLREAK